MKCLEDSGSDTVNPLDVKAAAIRNGDDWRTADQRRRPQRTSRSWGGIDQRIYGSGSGFRNRIINHSAGISEDRIVSSPGSYNATATLTSGGWVMQIGHLPRQRTGWVKSSADGDDDFAEFGVSQWWNGSDDYGDGVRGGSDGESRRDGGDGRDGGEQHVDHGDDGGARGGHGERGGDEHGRPEWDLVGWLYLYLFGRWRRHQFRAGEIGGGDFRGFGGDYLCCANCGRLECGGSDVGDTTSTVSSVTDSKGNIYARRWAPPKPRG